jgi:hypothetical protein
MPRDPDFWTQLAPDLAAIEDSYLDLASLRRMMPDIQAPVLVVGAGQGLIVGELRRRGLVCQGVDLTPEMIRLAKQRRGLDVIQADARALPFASGAFRSVVCATGVVDFMSDEPSIKRVLDETRRVAGAHGRVLVAFYKMSRASQRLLRRLGLLDAQVLRHREALEVHQLDPRQTVAWVSRRARVRSMRATMLLLRTWFGLSRQEKRNAASMRRIFSARDRASALLTAAHEEQPYRDAAAIEDLFRRLGVPMLTLSSYGSCDVVRIACLPLDLNRSASSARRQRVGGRF